MKNSIKNIIANEDGQGMVEYGLIIGLVAIVAIVGLLALGPKIREMFTNAGNKLVITTSI